MSDSLVRAARGCDPPGATHHLALRALANRMVGVLRGCLRHDTRHDETAAWRLEAEHIQAAA